MLCFLCFIYFYVNCLIYLILRFLNKDLGELFFVLKWYIILKKKDVFLFMIIIIIDSNQRDYFLVENNLKLVYNKESYN